MECALDDLIPHRAPMRLISDIVDATDRTATIRALVEPDWPLSDGQAADPLVLVEVFAQSAAALAGWKKRHEERLGGRGLLVGLRRSKLCPQPIPVGTELFCEVTLDTTVDTYAVFRGRVRSADACLAELEIQSLQPGRDFPFEESAS